VPRQVRALARKSAFNARARENAIYIIDAFAYDAPKTSRLFDLLVRLDVADKNVLILTHGVKANVYLSGRNLPNVHVMPYADVSTYLLLWSDVVLVESEAMGFAMAPIAEKEPAERPRAKKREAAAAKGEATAKKATKREAAGAKRGATKKPAAKKPAAKARAASKPAAKKSTAKKPAAKPKKKGK
jgi:Ribosomal protein L4/L1 family